MVGNQEYTGISIEDNLLKIVRLKSERGGLRLIKLDKFSLVEVLERKRATQSQSFEDDFSIDDEADSVFGLEESMESGIEEPTETDLNLDDFEDEELGGDDDLMSLDMVDESETAQSNEVLLYNILSSIGEKKLRLGLNVAAGDSIFQIIRDTDFTRVKEKDLVIDIEEKLESIYGMPKTSDNYDYEVRDDGSLMLVSIDDNPALLNLVENTRELYSGKLIIEDVIPDEILLVGMVRANYALQQDHITGIIQFGQSKCRIVFMRGREIWLVSPIINEGTKNKGFLNTVFSKILFQLDTGEVPSLDRLIIANNSIGDEAVDFFRKNFPDISVEEFTFDQGKFDFGNQDPASSRGFTTAIGLAWAVSGFEKDSFPSISLIPSDILDRQKIFKLTWHGILLLVLIGLSPIIFNYFYQQNAQLIESLDAELVRTNTRITEIQPTVDAANKLSDELSLIREKLVLLDTLSRGSHEWSTKLDVLNNGSSNIRSSWVTSFEYSDNGIFIDGYSLYRNQIPRIVDIFHDATLLSVDIDEVREQEIYRFSIQIKGFVRNKSRYSPPRPDDLKTILGQ